MNSGEELSPKHETEICILGGILLKPDVIIEVRPIIKPCYFSVYVYQKTYEIILKLYDEGGFDEIILEQELRKNGIDVGGKNAISDWMTLAVTAYQTVPHAKKLVEQWKEREFEKTCYDSLEKLSGSDHINQIYEDHTQKISELAFQGFSRTMSAKEVVKHNRRANRLSPVNTGYKALNDYFGDGLDRGTVTIIGGSTSIGKSQMALNIIRKTCNNQASTRCLYIVQEMNPESVEDRLVSTISGIPQGVCKLLRLKSDESNDRYKSITEKYSDDYNTAVKDFSNMQLYIHAEGTITAQEFRNIVAKYNKKVDLIVLDYLQQCRESRSGQEPRERIDEISRTCKHIATLHNVAVIALAQLSRDGAKAGNQNDNGRPKLWHLKESSSIEQDADHVILLYRKNAKQAESETIELDICKNRHGQTGRLNFIFNLNTGIIEDPMEDN